MRSVRRVSSEIRWCLVCGESFTAADWRRKTCGQRCADERRRSAKRAKDRRAYQRQRERRLAYLADYRRRPYVQAKEARRSRERNRDRRSALAELGWTPTGLALLTLAFDNRCEICGAQETAVGPNGSVRPLALDHDHETGEFRGLLCTRCNTALGLFGDDPKRLRRAIHYLVIAGQKELMAEVSP